MKLREKNGSISLIVPEANSLGLAMLGGESVDSALQAVIDGKADALVVLENDLYTRTDSAKVDAALNAAKVLIVADHQKTATSERADLVLPAATFAEGDGTLVSQEGRAQRFFQVFDPEYMDASILVHEGWRWLHALRSTLLNQPIDWTQPRPRHRSRRGERPATGAYRRRCTVCRVPHHGVMKLAREPLRHSGRTAMRADISVHEPRTPQDNDTAFAFSMEGYSGSVEPRQQVPFAWSPGSNPAQAWNKFQDEVGGHIRAGDLGTRLIEPQGDALNWFAAVPRPFNPAQGTWQVVPFFHLFGSDETSSKAAPVQERIPAAYVSLAKSEADRLGVNDGALLSLNVAGKTLRLPLRINDELGAGLAALPKGIAGIPPSIFGQTVDGLQEAASTWFTPEVIDVIIAVVKAIVILLAVVVAGALLSFVERRLLGWWQDRYGPNRVGPFGMFQIAADMLKNVLQGRLDATVCRQGDLHPGTGRGHERLADRLLDHPDHPDLAWRT